VGNYSLVAVGESARGSVVTFPLSPFVYTFTMYMYYTNLTHTIYTHAHIIHMYTMHTHIHNMHTCTHMNVPPCMI